MYTKTEISVQVYEDNTGSIIYAKKDESNVDEVDRTENHPERFTLAGNATDQAFHFGQLTTAHTVYITSNREISVKFNGSSVALPIGRANTKKGGLCIQETSITSLSLTNNSGEDAEVYVCLAGK